jgi:hypothetical protein
MDGISVVWTEALISHIRFQLCHINTMLAITAFIYCITYDIYFIYTYKPLFVFVCVCVCTRLCKLAYKSVGLRKMYNVYPEHH